MAWTVRVERDEGGIQPRVTKRRRPEETKRDERFKRLEGLLTKRLSDRSGSRRSSESRVVYRSSR